jgi:hypothetical protein
VPTPTLLDSGTDATQGMEFATAIVGTVTSDTTPRTGPRAYKCHAAGTTASVRWDGVLAAAGRRLSFGFRFSATPTANGAILFSHDGAVAFKIFLRTDRTLGLYNNADALLVGGTTVLSTATYYRISVGYTITSTTVNEFRIYIGGVLEITASNVTLATTNAGNLLLMANFNLGNPFDVWFDDIYVDNGTDLTDPGDIHLTAKLPASVNTGGWDTTVGTGAVDERPLSEANGMQETTVNGDQQNYALQAAAVGDVDIAASTLVARSAWIWAKVSVASVLAKLMDNGSESAVTLTTTAALYTRLTESAVYPSDAAGIGARSSTTPDTFLYECGALLAYRPAVDDGACSTTILRSRMRSW